MNPLIFSLAFLLGSHVTFYTAFFIISLDCIPNIMAFIKILKLQYQGTTVAKEQQNAYVKSIFGMFHHLTSFSVCPDLIITCLYYIIQ